jgi:hypothetical protein
MTLRTLAPILSALIALLALPAGAAAAVVTVQPLKPCYVSVTADEREAIVLMASGFTPGARVDVSIDGQPAVAGVGVDGAGGLVTQVEAPHQPKGERRFAVGLVERENPANRATVFSRVTALAVSVKPRRARPRHRVMLRGRGFTSEGGVFGHYTYAGQERATVWLARPKAPCGTFAVRRRQIPSRNPRPGLWTLQVDQQSAYSPRPESVFVRIDITVERVFRTPRAAPS